MVEKMELTSSYNTLLAEVRGKRKGERARREDISRKITVIPQREDWICTGSPSIRGKGLIPTRFSTRYDN